MIAATPVPMSGVEAVLFDAAGTLIDTREPVGESYARLAERHGVTLPARRLDDAFRRALAAAPPRVFPAAAREEIADLERRWWREVVRSTFLWTDATARFDDFDRFFGDLFDHFARAEAWRPREGAVAVLDALRARGVSTGVVSNFDIRLPPILAGLGLLERLDVVVLPSDAGAEKPDPAIFRLALERLGCAPEAAVYVGDDPERDIAAASALGLRAVAEDSLATLTDLPQQLEVSAKEDAP